MRYLIIVLGLGLSGCGAAPSTAALSGPASPPAASASNTLSISLLASRIEPGEGDDTATYSITSGNAVTVPATLDSLSNASEATTTDLYIGSVMCSYHHAVNAMIYTLTPGGCTGGYVAGDSVPVINGTILSLTVELTSGPNTTRANAALTIAL